MKVNYVLPLRLLEEDTLAVGLFEEFYGWMSGSQKVIAIEPGEKF
jgi:hypothetical protein